MNKHPFEEEAELREVLLRADRRAQHTGKLVFAGGEAEAARVREEAAQLRRLARVDRDNGWPWGE